MIEKRNVQIPLALFNNLIGLFEYLALRRQDFPALFNFNSVLAELREKQRRINIHTAYSNSMRAMDDDQRELAYSNYLMLKKQSLKG